MARMDADRVGTYRSDINRAARKHGMEPAVVAGIMSRESRGGNTLNNGWGDNGKAWGLMQVDVTPTGGNHPKVGGPTSYEHIDYATGTLAKFTKKIGEKYPHWSEEQKLKGGIAAYNMGDRSVHHDKDVDANTTGGDYANDVVARAQWYKDNQGF